MYNAKDAGRNTYRFFSEAMNLRAHEHLLLQNRLHIWRSPTGNSDWIINPNWISSVAMLSALEALLRWHSPNWDIYRPTVSSRCRRLRTDRSDRRLGVAGGLSQARAWQDAGLPELCVSVNLSRCSSAATILVETVASALQTSGLAPRLLELELTETMLLQNVENTLATVRKLKAMGVAW